MKKIKLEPTGIVFVDDADYEKLNVLNWRLLKPKKGGVYASAGNGRLMHRELLELIKGQQVDHINGDGLDNRRVNLRVCSGTQNQMNRGKTKLNTSGYKGVTWNKQTNKWHAKVWVSRKSIHLGLFLNKEDAAYAYNKAVKRYFDNYAYLN